MAMGMEVFLWFAKNTKKNIKQIKVNGKMIGGFDTLQLLGFSEEKADELRNRFKENRKKARDKASVRQDGFIEVYEKINNQGER